MYTFKLKDEKNKLKRLENIKAVSEKVDLALLDAPKVVILNRPRGVVFSMPQTKSRFQFLVIDEVNKVIGNQVFVCGENQLSFQYIYGQKILIIPILKKEAPIRFQTGIKATIHNN